MTEQRRTEGKKGNRKKSRKQDGDRKKAKKRTRILIGICQMHFITEMRGKLGRKKFKWNEITEQRRTEENKGNRKRRQVKRRERESWFASVKYIL